MEIRFHGRGGQGAVTGTRILATAFYYEGKFTQGIPMYGTERRGAPVVGYKPKELKPVKDVLRGQGRFRHLTDDEVDEVQGYVFKQWERLLEKDGGPLL
jgi:pyruvate/2-oxoacid:ferredoxin oxidoreductase beta subunit